MTDGAAAVMLMTRREADRRGLPVLGIFRSFAAVGVPPAVMGIGPAVAIPAAVEMAGLALDDIDVYEINEAFASQASRCGRRRRHARLAVHCCAQPMRVVVQAGRGCDGQCPA